MDRRNFRLALALNVLLAALLLLSFVSASIALPSLQPERVWLHSGPQLF